MSDSGQSDKLKAKWRQLELFTSSAEEAAPAHKPVVVSAPPRPVSLRVIKGEGKKREQKLSDRDAVARVLVGAAADLLLRRITPDRAHALERQVEKVLNLFDRVDGTPALLPVLNRDLDALEALVRDSEQLRRRK